MSDNFEDEFENEFEIPEIPETDDSISPDLPEDIDKDFDDDLEEDLDIPTPPEDTVDKLERKYIRYWLFKTDILEDGTEISFYGFYDSDDTLYRETIGFLSQLKYKECTEEEFETEKPLILYDYEQISEDINITVQRIVYAYSSYCETENVVPIIQGPCVTCKNCLIIGKENKPLKLTFRKTKFRNYRYLCKKHSFIDFISGEERFSFCAEYNLHGECRLYEKIEEEVSEDNIKEDISKPEEEIEENTNIQEDSND